eukprot:2409613-Lingulodinium_polyedra.AAC.1
MHCCAPGRGPGRWRATPARTAQGRAAIGAAGSVPPQGGEAPGQVCRCTAGLAADPHPPTGSSL